MSKLQESQLWDALQAITVTRTWVIDRLTSHVCDATVLTRRCVNATAQCKHLIANKELGSVITIEIGGNHGDIKIVLMLIASSKMHSGVKKNLVAPISDCRNECRRYIAALR